MAALSEKEIEQIIERLDDSDLSELSDSDDIGPEITLETNIESHVPVSEIEGIEEADGVSVNEIETVANGSDSLETHNEASEVHFVWKKKPFTCPDICFTGPVIIAD